MNEQIKLMIVNYRACLNADIDKYELSRAVGRQVGNRINLLAPGYIPQARVHFDYAIQKIASIINENIMGFDGEGFIKAVAQTLDFRLKIATGQGDYVADDLKYFLDPDFIVMAKTEAMENALGALLQAVSGIMGSAPSVESIAIAFGNYKPEEGV